MQRFIAHHSGKGISGFQLQRARHRKARTLKMHAKHATACKSKPQTSKPIEDTGTTRPRAVASNRQVACFFASLRRLSAASAESLHVQRGVGTAGRGNQRSTRAVCAQVTRLVHRLPAPGCSAALPVAATPSADDAQSACLSTDDQICPLVQAALVHGRQFSAAA